MAAPTNSFDPSLPTLKDQARMRVGDVNQNPIWFAADETINAWLGMYTFDETCARYAEAIGAQCNQLETQVQQRNLKRAYADRAKTAFQLADRIRDLASSEPGDPQQTGAGVAAMSDCDLRGSLIYVPGQHPRLGGW